jgi:hypothetical protein
MTPPWPQPSQTPKWISLISDKRKLVMKTMPAPLPRKETSVRPASRVRSLELPPRLTRLRLCYITEIFTVASIIARILMVPAASITESKFHDSPAGFWLRVCSRIAHAWQRGRCGTHAVGPPRNATKSRRLIRSPRRLTTCGYPLEAGVLSRLLPGRT